MRGDSPIITPHFIKYLLKMSNLIIKNIKQSEKASCGAATLCMIYNYLGMSDQREKDVWDRLKVPRESIKDSYYIRSSDLIRDAEKHGFDYFIAQAVLKSSSLALQPIREFLSLSIPVIVCQKISKTNQFGHFRLVTGINKKNVIVNDPMNENAGVNMNIKDFIKLWEKNDNGEVIGGQLIAIFNKKQIKKKNKFTVSTFNSSLKYFVATSLNFK
jgi:predicted double-glycine peptidase